MRFKKPRFGWSSLNPLVTLCFTLFFSFLYFKKQFHAALLLGLLLSGVILPLAAQGTFDQGMASYRAGDYQTAFQILKPLAEQGNMEAQRRLGIMYRHGKGVAQNDELALKWYRRAAQQGHVLAQNSLGIMYRFGLGVKKNPKQALYWSERAGVSVR